MLRISIQNDTDVLTFRLEGRLAGSWVQELEECCQLALAPQPGTPVRFDLTEVTFVDAPGKAFLAARHAQGAKLVACGCQMRALVAEITGAPLFGCGAHREQNHSLIKGD